MFKCQMGAFKMPKFPFTKQNIGVKNALKFACKITKSVFLLPQMGHLKCVKLTFKWQIKQLWNWPLVIVK